MGGDHQGYRIVECPSWIVRRNARGLDNGRASRRPFTCQTLHTTTVADIEPAHLATNTLLTRAKLSVIKARRFFTSAHTHKPFLPTGEVLEQFVTSIVLIERVAIEDSGVNLLNRISELGVHR